MTYYRTTKKLNYRTGPGTKYTLVGKLDNGALIKVVGNVGKWLKFQKNNKYYYCSGSYVKKATDYGKLAAIQTEKIAKDVVGKKVPHVSGKYRYEGKKVNCSVFVSACLQEAGLLPKSVTVYHTSKDHKKSSLGDCVHNRLKVDHYSWHKTNKLYKNMPASYKKKGCIYVYQSSIAIVGDDGKIYGCHSSGKKYTKLSMVKHTSKKDYEYTHSILVVGVPRIE